MAIEIPKTWERGGLILPRAVSGVGSSVVGDPCIVWDDDIANWRMFLFLDPPGSGDAVCNAPSTVGAGAWSTPGPLKFTNPEAQLGSYAHKPTIVMQAGLPNQAARIDGKFCLLVVGSRSSASAPYHKVVQRAWANHLAGPWTLEPVPLIDIGLPHEFDGRHIDAVTGFHFPDRSEILYFYMGYPLEAQARAISPYGSAQAAAVERIGSGIVRKLGPILPPCQESGHWASGWVGGLEILSGRSHRWIGIANASPTAPIPNGEEVFSEEPPPSLGGFAVCDEEWPVTGWRWCPQPIEWIEDIPDDMTQKTGEGTNLWRHHILVRPDGTIALFYNSGYYGREQLFVKYASEVSV